MPTVKVRDSESFDLSLRRSSANAIRLEYFPKRGDASITRNQQPYENANTQRLENDFKSESKTTPSGFTNTINSR